MSWGEEGKSEKGVSGEPSREESLRGPGGSPLGQTGTREGGKKSCFDHHGLTEKGGQGRNIPKDLGGTHRIGLPKGDAAEDSGDPREFYEKGDGERQKMCVTNGERKKPGGRSERR